MIACDLLDMAYGDVESEHDDDHDEDVEDETKTPMERLDALRALPRVAKKIAMAKYLEKGRGFSLHKFYSDEREVHKEAFRLTRRTLYHPSSQDVSESTFSIHVAFADELRTNMSMSPMMVQFNRNHKFLFHRIRSKIKAAYFAKNGRKNFIHPGNMPVSSVEE